MADYRPYVRRYDAISVQLKWNVRENWMVQLENVNAFRNNVIISHPPLVIMLTWPSSHFCIWQGWKGGIVLLWRDSRALLGPLNSIALVPPVSGKDDEAREEALRNTIRNGTGVEWGMVDLWPSSDVAYWHDGRCFKCISHATFILMLIDSLCSWKWWR